MTLGRMRALLVALVIILAGAAGGARRLAPQTAPQPSADRDALAFARDMDAAGARGAWPGFTVSEWPVALFDGTRTVLLRHPSPPPEFSPLEGRPGVFVMQGRHPAVVANSTREIGGVRTGTVIISPSQTLEQTMLPYVEELFHVFWLKRHTNFRPNEMTRYAYPVKDPGNLRRLLAEAEALARAIESPSSEQAAAWAATALQVRRERVGQLSVEERAFEAALEMMEGTANYVARIAAGQTPGATTARLRAAREADGIRWRFYDTGAAICFLLDRLAPDWKTRIDADIETTISTILEAAVGRAAAPPSAFSASDLAGFERRAAVSIAALSERQAKLRDEVLTRPGARLVVEVAGEAEPFRVARFDPIDLLVLDAGEVAHPNYLTLNGSAGTIEVSNPTFVRGSFSGSVALTRSAGRHPLTSGIRSLTVTGLKGTPAVERRGDGVAVEAEGLRLSLRGAEVRVDGQTVRVTLSAAR